MGVRELNCQQSTNDLDFTLESTDIATTTKATSIQHYVLQ